MLDAAAESRDLQEQLWIACARDELFFVNAFLWVFEPRDEVIYPFLTWPYEDRCLLQMDEAIGKKDVGIEKSRDMGATWMFLTSFFYRWMFRRRQVFGVVSSTEDKVDKPEDPDTLFWKLDFHWDNLPAWMQPSRQRNNCSLKNNHTQSVITGYACTADVARGGRKLTFGMDELASWGIDRGYHAWSSTQHVCRSRIVVSTPRGFAGIFAEQMRAPDASMVKISIHWSEHPEKQKGLYASHNGILDVIDTDYRFPPDYQFICDAKLRSPWYDEECRRHPVPAMIAEELDIDYGGSGSPFFRSHMVDDHKRLYGRPPFKRGELIFDESLTPSWTQLDNGRMSLWIHMTVDGEPPHNEDYVIGCDIATGVGGEMSTNSIASVVNRATGEKVAEVVAHTLFPDKFADYVVALRKWFHGPTGEAYVIWEMNGPGLQFGRHMMQISPGRIYYKRDVKVVGGKASRQPGWFSNKETKRLLLGEYGKAIERGYFINHSIHALDEMFHYIYFPDGSIDHDRAKSTIDPTSSGENHGDRVIADAVAWRLIGSVSPRESSKAPATVPRGSMAWRKERALELSRSRKDAWL